MSRAAALSEVQAIRARLDALEALLKADAANDAKPAPAPIPVALPGLQTPAAFFAVLRQSKILGDELEQSEVAGCNAILVACAGRLPLSWTAYALATPWLETGGKMQPVHEGGGTAYFHRMYDIEGARPAKARELGNLTPGDGALFHGRGLPQITGRANYRKATKRLRELGLLTAIEDLERTPDLALRPDISAACLVIGMLEGWYTGKKLNDFIPASATRAHYVNARRIINGQDRAGDIADAALVFERALRAGGWR